VSPDAAQLAATLGPLRLGRARARTASHHGRHARRTAGAGDAFWQYRPLQPGEGVNRVDWRKSAREETPLVREREREDPVRLLLWTDGSPSMDFASRTSHPTKLAAARALTGALAIAAHAADERVARLAGPAEPLATLLAHPDDGALPDPATLRTGDAVVIAGDFLDGDAAAWVSSAARSGAVGVAIQLIDPAEDTFPFAGRLRFEPVEPGDVPLDLAKADDLRADYLAAWAAHCAGLDRIAAEAGWTLIRHRVDGDAAATLAAVAAWLQG